MKLETLMDRLFRVVELKRLSATILGEMRGFGEAISSQFRPGSELIAEAARMKDAIELLQKERQKILDILEAAKEGGPIAFGVVGRDGVLSTHPVGEYDPVGLQEYLQRACRACAPLFTEDWVKTWDQNNPMCWGYRTRTLGNRVADTYRKADHMENVGYPVPIFTIFQEEAWTTKRENGQWHDQRSFIDFFYLQGTDHGN
jgi:hypothetical protein